MDIEARQKPSLEHLMNRILCFATLLVTLVAVPSVHGEEPLQYNRDIRPILAENCFACHGADSAARKADLRLDRREDAIDMGAITPNDAVASELVARIFTDDDELLMPPPVTKKSLSVEQKETLRRWIEQGAEYQAHWSFIPPQVPERPTVSNEGWVRNDIDRFVLARLEQEGITAAPEADARTLFRRLHFDITGLPPKPADLEEFVADYESRKDVALSEWIDRLMESPTWGEHRGRYWLDAARYADTHGLHFDNYREIWPYRDWVIRAFNANQPFNDFIVEQLAGDLLPDPTDQQLVATGFQRCNITTNEGGTIDAENLALYAVDRVQTFGWVFLGLTTNCAQCHDHKFDPITARDFYSLAAFFGNTESPPKDGNTKDGQGPTLLVPLEEDMQRWTALPDEIEAAEKQLADRKENSRVDFEKWLAETTPESFAELPTDKLVLHVPLDEGTGKTIRNLAGSPSSFTTSNPIKWRPDGILGPAPLLQAAHTFKLLGDQGDFELDEAFSFGTWAKTTEKGASLGVNAAILARMDQRDGHRGWDLWQNGTAFAVHLIDSWDDNALKVGTKQGVATPGRWQHVFATYDGSRKPEGVKIYVDGKPVPVDVEKNTLKANASIRTTSPFRIGKRSNDAIFDRGMVQDVRLYARQLESAEVEALAKAAPLRTILAKAESDRSEQDQAYLFDHYLTNSDRKYPSLAAALQELESEQNDIRARSPITHVQKEKQDSKPMAHILMRGAYDRPGEEVAANTPAALHPLPEDAPRNRLGLAKWVIDPANPLTARVTVNRFWLELFGQGIVATPEDFGIAGGLPSHPELLDWLALDFTQHDWDVKRFFKQMLMSATYRQSAKTTPEKLEADPHNILLSRGPRFRMDAEMVRDTALSVSGLLSPKMYGPGTRPYQPENIWEIVGLPGGDTRVYKQDTGENLYRRTLYNFWKRMAPPPSLEAFNAPSREFCTVQRERTNTPLQALVTLNDPQYVEAARKLAEHALRASSGDDAIALEFVAKRVLGRHLTSEEQRIALAAKSDYFEHYQAHAEDAKALLAVGESETDESLDTAQLAAWAMVCNQIMNLDEAINK